METPQERLVRRIRPGDSYEKLLSFPSYIEIETVNACNARCPMCTIDDWERRDGLMDDELFDKIAYEIGNHSAEVKRVALYRDGEPLLDKHLSRKVAMLKGLGVKKVGISTNAALLTPERAKKLLIAGLDEILLSVDSLKPEVYEAIRVKLKFDEVLANCLNFIEQRDALRSSCQVWVRMIRQESNKDEWPEFEAFWKSKFSPTDRVDYRNLHNWGSSLVSFHPVMQAETEKPCVALWSQLIVFANGDVPLCSVDYNNRYPLGNLRNSSIVELWTSLEAQRRRGLHLDGKRQDIPPCISCTAWSDDANAP